MTTTATEPNRPATMGTLVLSELRELRQEVEVLTQFAQLLGQQNQNGETYLTTTVRLLTLLVAGTEKTHAYLETLHSMMSDRRIARALKQIALDD